MPLPDDFTFSQNSLQDYVDCPRRFELRYLLRLSWPAVESEPALENEKFLRQGSEFHRLVHQHQMGIPAARLQETITGPEIAIWWRNYLEGGPPDLPPQRYPEISLTAPLGSYRLAARYDLIAIDPGRRGIIVDWKTTRRTSHEWLRNRMQTRVYPYLLARAGAELNGKPFDPEQVEMIYWFANAPADPVHFLYDRDHYNQDQRDLSSLIREIENFAGSEFPLTGDPRYCRFCPYRSLCDRGVQAGKLDDEEEQAGWQEPEAGELALDLDQIAEIEF